MDDVRLVPDAIGELSRTGMLEPGKVIEHGWIDRALMLNRAAKDYAFKRLSRFQELRTRLLLEHKVDLQSVRGRGYIVINPEEQTRTALSDTSRKIGKAIMEGSMRVQNVDVAKLSAAARQENIDALTRLSALGSMARGQITGTPA